MCGVQAGRLWQVCLITSDQTMRAALASFKHTRSSLHTQHTLSLYTCCLRSI